MPSPRNQKKSIITGKSCPVPTVEKAPQKESDFLGYKTCIHICRTSQNSGGYLALDELSSFREETVSRSAASLVLNCTRLTGVAEQFPRPHPCFFTHNMRSADYYYS